MEVRQRGLIAGFLTAALLVAPLAAEAKRAGGGKSHGMSRQAAPTQSYQQPRQATPAQQPTAPATAPAKSGPGVGGMVAAGVAGAAIGAVAANALADENSASQAQAQEEKGGIPSWIWILLAAAVAFFIFRKMGAKKKVAPNPYAPNNGSTQAPFGQQAAPRTSNDNSNIFGQSVGGSAAAPQNNAPFSTAYTNSLGFEHQSLQDKYRHPASLFPSDHESMHHCLAQSVLSLAV